MHSDSDDVPKWQQHRVDARHSLRFLSTRQHLQESVEAELSRDASNLRNETKGRPVVIDAVDKALDAFVRCHFPWTHQSILPREACAKAAAAYHQITSESDLARALAPKVETPDSALADLAGEMLATITATAALFPSPLASAAHDNSPPPAPVTGSSPRAAPRARAIQVLYSVCREKAASDPDAC